MGGTSSSYLELIKPYRVCDAIYTSGACSMIVVPSWRRRDGGGDRLASQHAAISVHFRKIPCVYRDKNLSVQVEETSTRGRGHLAVRFIYQGGQNDIVAVEVARDVNDGDRDSAQPPAWRYMTRREGSATVWRTSRAPAGPLRLRIVVTADEDGVKELR